MSKITLTSLVNLENQTSAVNDINNNNAAITTAMDNTLSRDGTSPNTMGSNLDMNSYHILNLPAPTSNYEPLRVIDAHTLNGGSPINVSSLPAGGTTGQALVKNSGTNYDVAWTSLSSINYTAPFTGATNRTLNSKLSDLASVLDFGASNIGAESTAAFNAAFANASAIIIPPGTYALSGDVQIPSNRFIWVQKGATITNTGGRFTGYVPGGGNIELRIDGVMAFLATATAPAQNGTNGWDTAVGTQHNRGLIEIGGDRVGTQASGVFIYGTGEVYSDYVWPGTPPNGFTNIDFQLNRKGIAVFNTSNVRVEGLYVHIIYGEAIYCQAPAITANVQFNKNRVENAAFDALNFNSVSASPTFVMDSNVVTNAWVGIEASCGHIRNNSLNGTRAAINTGGGGGAGDLIIQGNRIQTALDAGITVSYTGVQERVIICDNSMSSMGTYGINVNNIAEFTIVNNNIYQWAQLSAAAGITVFSATSNGYVNGNIIHSPGTFSSGTIINAGTLVTVGTNIIT